METFAIATTKKDLSEKIKEMMTTEERMALDAGIAFGGVNEDGDILIGEDNQWKVFEQLKTNYNL